MDINFGKKILELRKFYNLTQAELADLIGATRVRIAQIELNNNKPTLSIIIEVINKFGISADYFFKNNISLSNNNDINNNINLIKEPKGYYNKETKSDNFIDRIKSLEEILESKNELISNQSEMIEILKAQLKSLKSK